ncbi:hypothetical protein VFPPC_05892 [Pochonia chlamydosporia 170]|uniref:Uncharacterized protein n=1 Tax=Pochonia chlamydosporia 170 TaxID=1380566 RepID=A0A179FH23_METCM|nr:hypothetical protein VFPPC_05892 [Pochonia chlamydosporia 170]OAQ64638.1 hypothetical protein VFPPC_05892 [Pochonia chlamydosporia 170]
MPTKAEWLTAQVAPTKTALNDGDGCHADEAKSLTDYLEDKSTAQEAATAFTAPLLAEDDPAASLFRPMGLLCEALVELGDDRDKLLDLLAAMQQLPPTSDINWRDLPGFGNMWSDLYRLYTHGSTPWEKTELSDERRLELQQHFEATGSVEAELYLRGLDGVTARWGYETLSLICARRVGVEVFIGAMYAWLKVAGEKLKGDLRQDEVCRYGEERRMGDHWEMWKSAFLEGAGDGSWGSEARRMALECHELMK